MLRDTSRRARRKVVFKIMSLLTVCCLLITNGCGGDFLGLEDYQRDLLFGFGSLALNLLGLTPGGIGQPGPGDGDGDGDGDGGGVGQPDPGDTVTGLNCWDLNGNGLGDTDEDRNADGIFDAQDCQGDPGAQGDQGDPGPAGTDGDDGEPGAAGDPGAPGPSGLNCWDLDGDGNADPNEDINEDGVHDAEDCRGDDGRPGSQGPQGEQGPSYFSLFIDDFFTVQTGSYDGLLVLDADGVGGLVPVPVREPALGCVEFGPSPNPQEVEVLAYRVAIPQQYDANNPVMMRTFLWRTGEVEPFDCFIFRLDAFVARHGTTIGPYGGTRFVRVEVPTVDEVTEDGMLLVVDVPLNTPLGLDGDALAIADFLAFEINALEQPQFNDGGCYTWLGVEFFEDDSQTLAGAGLLIEPSCEDCMSDPNDCNENGTPDACEIQNCPEENLCCQDPDGNGVPNECEIIDCETICDPSCGDCNENCQPDGLDIALGLSPDDNPACADCDVARPGDQGCSDAGCEELVCEGIGFETCCDDPDTEELDGSWTQACADRAMELCVCVGNGIPDECENSCPANLIDQPDGVVDEVDSADLAVLLGAWGGCAGCPEDLDRNCDVNAIDLALLLGAWGPCPPSGACCIFGDCVDDLTLAQCVDLDGVYQGHSSICAEVDCEPIPAAATPSTGGEPSPDQEPDTLPEIMPPDILEFIEGAPR